MLVRWPHHRTLDRWDATTEDLLTRLGSPEGVEVDPGLLDGGPALPGTHLPDELLDDGWLTLTVVSGFEPVFTVLPRRQPPQRPLPPVSEPRLSRHAVLVPADSGWHLEAPHSWCDLLFPNLEQLHRCLETSGRTSLEEQVLLWGGALVEPREEQERLSHRQWSAHELWFHERSRRYGRERGFGGTFWARDIFPPPPLQPAEAPAVTVRFAAADLEALGARSLSLHRALEDRRSIRRHDDDAPLDRDRLGEFLYRTARLRLVQEVEGVDYGSKPYPSGGSVYETEIYLLVRHVRDLAPGLWRYDPTEHGLAPVREGLEHPDVAALLREAAHSSTVDALPQVTLLMAPRFGRILWKYEQMGYAVMLKHIGVLMQTMYLVATDMGLAACAIGSGDSDLFSRATGLDPLECTSVGEFLLGTPHPDERFQERPA
ncbi:SagB/ThcOx family dehydrogenase [Nesterenkonia alkaliphila]|uniref:SagB/ThcOx family dehydrogenase n=1 Tax=Nesterenkonia alkaliphila TaxID=1463631 RepID=A0A7K1UFA6_9MICC|nr:SagB family peptide dehydrogenase [Nesterenkonia alkaliphila]MVT25112.1 SagB/ThcOx family dehydrogenase [Nesterenkonia alkaliphila]